MKILLFCAALVLPLLSPGCASAEDSPSEWEASVLEVGGPVDLQPAGAADWEPAQEQTPLQSGDRIKTGKGGFARVSLDGEAILELDELSQLTVRSVQYSSASFSLSAGALLGKIKDLFARKRRFEVRTPAAVCAVRGTEFAVSHSTASGDTAAGVFDNGEVLLGGVSDKESDYVSVSSGREAVLSPGGARPHVGEMQRLKRRKARMAQVSLRVDALKSTWRRSDAKQRALLRRQLLKQRKAASAQGRAEALDKKRNARQAQARRQAEARQQKAEIRQRRQEQLQRRAARQAAMAEKKKRGAPGTKRRAGKPLAGE